MALRALAHPLRWKLIDLLGSEQSATATRCSEVLGESVASCGYHLGILAKYGYIEPDGERAGREKPWRLTSRHQELSPAGLDESGALAAQAATEVFLDHELERIKDRLRRLDLEPGEWRAASYVSGTTHWLTADELAEIKNQLADIQARYSDRDDDPARRPPDAREVRIFTVTSVAPRLSGSR
jgi:Helix-turn-helix domain